MMYRGGFSQLMVPGLKRRFAQFLEMQQRDSEYDKVFRVENSDRAWEDYVEFAGLGPMVVKEEGETIQYDDAIQGGTKRFEHETFALGVRSSWELYKDDQYGLIKQTPKALSRAAHFIKEQRAWNTLNNGFTTVTTVDGVSLFNTAHPLLGGTEATQIGIGLTNIINSAGTYPNRPTPDADFSITSLQEAVDTFERMIDARGIPTVFKPRRAIIPPELKWVAREIFGSAYDPETSKNKINALVGEDFTFFISHYLTSDSAWFLVGDKEDHSLVFYNREALDDDFEDDFDTRALKHIATQRFSVGAENWYGVYGSNGA